MNEQELNTVAQLRAFLNGTQEVQFEPIGEDTQRYAFVAAVVQRLRYAHLPRPEKGVVMRYLERTTGYSRAQLKRLVRRARAGEVLAKRYRDHAKYKGKFLSYGKTDIPHFSVSAAPSLMDGLRFLVVLCGCRTVVHSQPRHRGTGTVQERQQGAIAYGTQGIKSILSQHPRNV